MVRRDEINTQSDELHHVRLGIDRPDIHLHAAGMGIPNPLRIAAQHIHLIVDAPNVGRKRPRTLVSVQIAHKHPRKFRRKPLADPVVERYEMPRDTRAETMASTTRLLFSVVLWGLISMTSFVEESSISSR